MLRKLKFIERIRIWLAAVIYFYLWYIRVNIIFVKLILIVTL